VDYSLLLIIDLDKKFIKIGIIDYLRKYTWDKEWETNFKTMIKLGLEPTIIPSSVIILLNKGICKKIY
jgi:hypothetical protein